MYAAPRRLRDGSRVALVAPASPFRSDELSAGIDIVRECGLEPVLGPNVRSLHTNNIHAAPLMARVDELMWAFTDPSIDGVITVLGGMGSGELLPYLDFGAIRRSQRVLIGISDITALNNGLLAGAGLISVCGQYPSIQLDQGPEARKGDTDSLVLALELMMSDQPWDDRPLAINQYVPRTVSPGKATGHVIGGNLDTYCTLLGSPFAPDPDGAILFVEDTGKGGTSLGRLLIHCKLAGVFDRIAGVVVGEFAKVPTKEEPKEPDPDDVIEEYLGKGVPCMYGISFSHGVMTCPIPIGATCTIDADRGDLAFDFTMAD